MKRLLISLALLASATLARADVIFDNGLGQNDQQSGFFSTALEQRRVYDDFSLPGTRTINSVFFQVGLTDGAFAGSFTFTVYNSDGQGTVGSVAGSSTLNVGDYSAVPNAIESFPYTPFYDVSFSIAPLTLGPGDYLLSFYGLDLSFRTANNGDENGFYLLEYEDTGAIYGLGGGLPFRLEGSTPGTGVPEPSSLLLAGIALAALAGARRRRRGGFPGSAP